MYALIPLLLTAICSIPMILFAVFFIVHMNKKEKAESRMQNMFRSALNYEHKAEDSKDKTNIFEKIGKRFDEILVGSDIITKERPRKVVYQWLMIISLTIFILTYLITGFKLFFSFFPVLLLFAGIYIYGTSKIANTDRMLEEQIPSFLSTLKSNVQANQTDERALMGAIDNTADPLYSELKVVKSLIETGTFETAMTALRNKTNSKTLKFLCSCVELSSEVGANLEEQIVVIEDMINRRKALDRKMDSAVAENKPLLYVAMITIPGLFIFTYLINAQTRAFWFHGLLSWVLFFFIIILCAFALWAGNKIINNVRKM